MKKAHGIMVALAASLILPAGLAFAEGSKDAVATVNGLPKMKQKSSYVIGFSAQQSDHPWTNALNNSIKTEGAKRGHKVIMTDAQGSTAKQMADVESLIAQGVDAIIITPREERPLAEVTLKAKKAGIPVFIVDRNVDQSVAKAGTDYVAFIGSDFVEEGRMSGRWLVKKLEGSGKVIELAGTTGSSAADDRGSGFREMIKGTGITIVASQDGDFVRDKGRRNMEALIQQYPDADAVFAHNDEMALGAITALQAAGVAPGKDIIIVSVDGQKEALEAIIAGTLGATAECNPRFGKAVFDAIEAYAEGKPVAPFMVNEDKFFDGSNAAVELPNAF